MSKNLVKKSNLQKPYGYVYKTTNLINGKIYIGQHSKDKFDIDYYGSGTNLKQDLKFFGKHNFKIEVLDWCETREELNKQEIFWIQEYNTYKNLFHYNKTLGGDGICKGFQHSQKTLDKRSLQRSKQIICLQTLTKFNSVKEAALAMNIHATSISEVLKNKKQHIKGYTFDYYDPTKVYTKKALVNQTRESLIAKALMKKIICLQTLEVFNSVKQAGLKLKIHPDSISKVLKGVQKSTKRYTFEYYDSNKTYTKALPDEKLKNNSQLHEKTQKAQKNKKVICLQTLEVFESIKKAAQKFDLNPTNLGSTLKGKFYYNKGYTFDYFDETKTYEKQQLLKPFSKEKSISKLNSKKIRCIETNQTFNSLTEASKKLNLNINTISNVLNRKQESTKNLHFVFI